MAARVLVGASNVVNKGTCGMRIVHQISIGLRFMKYTRSTIKSLSVDASSRTPELLLRGNSVRKCQYHTSSVCLVSDTKSAPSAPNLSSENLIESWFNEVKTFGTLTIHEVPFDVHIQPLNPMEYPKAHKSIVQVFYDARQAPGGEGPLPGQKLSEMSSLYDLKVSVDDDGEKMDVKCNLPPGVQLPVISIINLPLKFELQVEGRRGRDVTISNMESANVHVHLKKGSCHLHNLKSGTVNIQCDSGNITCKKPLLGNINMKCGGDGSIDAGQFQGTTVNCSTDRGHVSVDMLYAEESQFASHSGDLRIGGCHGSVNVESKKGSLTIGSMDGSLSAELGSGSADVFIARQDGVNISTKEGDVTLRFSQDYSCNLDLRAGSVERDDSLQLTLDDKGKGFLKSEGETKVIARAPAGKIMLKAQDWLASLKLRFGSPT